MEGAMVRWISLFPSKPAKGNSFDTYALWNTVLQGTDYNKNVTDLQSSERHSKQISLSVLLKTKLKILPLVWEIAKPEDAWRLQRESYYAVLSSLLMLFLWKRSAAVAWARMDMLCTTLRLLCSCKDLTNSEGTRKNKGRTASPASCMFALKMLNLVCAHCCYLVSRSKRGILVSLPQCNILLNT